MGVAAPPDLVQLTGSRFYPRAPGGQLLLSLPSGYLQRVTGNYLFTLQGRGHPVEEEAKLNVDLQCSPPKDGRRTLPSNAIAEHCAGGVTLKRAPSAIGQRELSIDSFDAGQLGSSSSQCRRPWVRLEVPPSKRGVEQWPGENRSPCSATMQVASPLRLDGYWYGGIRI